MAGRKGSTTLDVEGSAIFGLAVVCFGATRRFGYSGGFSVNLVWVRGVVVVPAIVELGGL